jgi:hypothetical protein
MVVCTTIMSPLETGNNKKKAAAGFTSTARTMPRNRAHYCTLTRCRRCFEKCFSTVLDPGEYARYHNTQDNSLRGDTSPSNGDSRRHHWTGCRQMHQPDVPNRILYTTIRVKNISYSHISLMIYLALLGSSEQAFNVQVYFPFFRSLQLILIACR